MPPFIASRFNLPPWRPVVENNEPSLTQQHFKDECDVNNILAKFVRTGIIETRKDGAYLDITDAPDYREALHQINKAETLFSEMPANIRKEFGNDPYKFLEFVHNPDNLEKGIELGVFKKPENVHPAKPNIDQGEPAASAGV